MIKRNKYNEEKLSIKLCKKIKPNIRLFTNQKIFQLSALKREISTIILVNIANYKSCCQIWNKNLLKQNLER